MLLEDLSDLKVSQTFASVIKMHTDQHGPPDANSLDEWVRLVPILSFCYSSLKGALVRSSRVFTSLNVDYKIWAWSTSIQDKTTF